MLNVSHWGQLTLNILWEGFSKLLQNWFNVLKNLLLDISISLSSYECITSRTLFNLIVVNQIHFHIQTRPRQVWGDRAAADSDRLQSRSGSRCRRSPSVIQEFSESGFPVHLMRYRRIPLSLVEIIRSSKIESIFFVV